MESEIEGDTARVIVVDGTMTYTDEYGEEVVEDAAEGDMEAVELVRGEGERYLSGDYLKKAGFDPEEIRDIDWDELDDASVDGEDDEEDGADARDPYDP